MSIDTATFVCGIPVNFDNEPRGDWPRRDRPAAGFLPADSVVVSVVVQY